MTWHQREKISSLLRRIRAPASSNAFGSASETPIAASQSASFENLSNIIATPSVVRMCASVRRT